MTKAYLEAKIQSTVYLNRDLRLKDLKKLEDINIKLIEYKK